MRTGPKSNKQTKRVAKSITRSHKYMTVHFPDLVNALQEKVAWLT